MVTPRHARSCSGGGALPSRPLDKRLNPSMRMLSTRTLVRLTATVFIVASSAPLAAQAPAEAQAAADLRAVENYTLTVPVLKKMAQVQENMYASVKAHPELARKYASQSMDEEDATTIDEMAKRLERIPEIKVAVTKAGFTSREYMIATMAMFQAAMASAVLDMPGADKGKLSANVRANAAFVKAHNAELTQMQVRAKELDKLTRPKRDSEGDSGEEEKTDTSGSRR
jgi:hypothetical protein